MSTTALNGHTIGSIDPVAQLALWAMRDERALDPGTLDCLRDAVSEAQRDAWDAWRVAGLASRFTPAGRTAARELARSLDDRLCRHQVVCCWAEAYTAPTPQKEQWARDGAERLGGARHPWR